MLQVISKMCHPRKFSSSCLQLLVNDFVALSLFIFWNSLKLETLCWRLSWSLKDVEQLVNELLRELRRDIAIPETLDGSSPKLCWVVWGEEVAMLQIELFLNHYNSFTISEFPAMTKSSTKAIMASWTWTKWSFLRTSQESDSIWAFLLLNISERGELAMIEEHPWVHEFDAWAARQLAPEQGLEGREGADWRAEECRCKCLTQQSLIDGSESWAVCTWERLPEVLRHTLSSLEVTFEHVQFATRTRTHDTSRLDDQPTFCWGEATERTGSQESWPSGPICLSCFVIAELTLSSENPWRSPCIDLILTDWEIIFLDLFKYC